MKCATPLIPHILNFLLCQLTRINKSMSEKLRKHQLLSNQLQNGNDHVKLLGQRGEMLPKDLYSMDASCKMYMVIEKQKQMKYCIYPCFRIPRDSIITDFNLNT